MEVGAGLLPGVCRAIVPSSSLDQALPGGPHSGISAPCVVCGARQRYRGGQLLSSFSLCRCPMRSSLSETTTENLSRGLASWGIS